MTHLWPTKEAWFKRTESGKIILDLSLHSNRMVPLLTIGGRVNFSRYSFEPKGLSITLKTVENFFERITQLYAQVAAHIRSLFINSVVTSKDLTEFYLIGIQQTPFLLELLIQLRHIIYPPHHADSLNK